MWIEAYLFDPRHYAFSGYAVPTLLTAALVLSLGASVLVRERGSWLSLLFLLLTLTIGIWQFAFSLMYCAADEYVAFWWAKAAYLGVPLIPSAIYHFTVAVLQLYERRKRLVWTCWALSVLFAWTIITTNSLISRLYHYWWGYYPRYGWLSVPYLIFFFGFMILSLAEYWLAYRRAAPATVHRRRTRALLLAFSVIYIGSFDYVAKYGIALYPFGYLPVLVFVGLAARAIWRYRLVDITPAVAAREIVETMPNALLVLDRDGLVRIANEAACTLLDMPQHLLVGRPLAALSNPLLNPELLNTLLREEAVRDHTITVLTSRRGQRTLSLSTASVRDHADQPVGIVCVLADITDRKRAEQELQAAHAELEKRVYERTAELSKTNALLKAALAERKEAEDELRRAQQELEERVAERTAKLATANEELMKEITERHLAERVLQEGEERLRAVVDTARDAIISADRHGIVVAWNRGAEAVFGYASAEVIGKPLTQLMPERFHRAHQQGLERLRQGGEAKLIGRTIELVGLRKSGVEFPMELSLSTWSTQQGTFFTAILRDITERKQAERQLTQTHAALKESYEELKSAHLQLIQAAKLESVGRLAAGVAHEVKNPLAVIMQGVDYLAKHVNGGNGDVALVLKYTGDAVRRADAVIRGLLDFSTRRELIRTPQALNPVIEQALLLVKHELDRAHLSVTKTLAEDLPPVLIDANKMEQVFVNLFMNAIHAMAEDGGAVSVRTYAKRLSEVGTDVGTRMLDRFRIGEPVVVVEVDDTGPGIPEPALHKVFDPFFTTKPTGKGTGLGLTVTKKIVELHGGMIAVDNRPEGGVRVSVVLRTQGGDRHGTQTHPAH
jgi:PAS domain S-box-containing protein